MLAHILFHALPDFCGNLALCNESFADGFHNLERTARFKPLVHEIDHDAVSRSDNLGNCAGSVLDKILRIAEPDVRSVGKTRNLQKVGKVLRLCVKEHLNNKRSSHFRNRQRSCRAINVLCCNAERRRACQHFINLRVADVRFHNGNSRQILKVLIKRWNIVTEVIKLQNCVMKRMEIKVSCGLPFC